MTQVLDLPLEEGKKLCDGAFQVLMEREEHRYNIMLVPPKKLSDIWTKPVVGMSLEGSRSEWSWAYINIHGSLLETKVLFIISKLI